MHEFTLTGPGLIVLIVFLYAVGAASLWLMIDVTRARRNSAFQTRSWVRWAWFAPQTIYFLMFVIQSLPWTTTPFIGTVLILSTPFAFAAQVAYLLRVVFPSPSRRAAQELAPANVGRLPEE